MELKIEVGYNTFKELSWLDTYRFSKRKKESFAEIAEKEKLINCNVRNYIKDKWWMGNCMGTDNFHNTKKSIELKVRERGTDLFHAMKKRIQVEQQI
jgi:hypothetical protein